LCYRLALANRSTAYIPIPSVVHFSSRNSDRVSEFAYIYTRRNTVLFLSKHHGALVASMMAGLLLLSAVLKLIKARLLNSDRRNLNLSTLKKLAKEVVSILV
ncbi:MAG: hypothetical protein V1763_00575, partial [Parcubacteria group bacterium]